MDMPARGDYIPKIAKANIFRGSVPMHILASINVNFGLEEPTWSHWLRLLIVTTFCIDCGLTGCLQQCVLHAAVYTVHIYD